jgi:hypothetical protein
VTVPGHAPTTGTPPYRTRLDVLFAERAHKAVILRRGPKTHYRLIAWDLASDSFTLGQWMKGLVRLFDLSPDGRTLIYWAAQYHPGAADRRRRASAHGTFDPVRAGTVKEAANLLRRGRKVPRYMRSPGGTATHLPQECSGTWTAVSTVPYFTALAIWPAFGHWTGGGVFVGDSRIVVFEPQSRMTPVVTIPIPIRVCIQSASTVVGLGAHMERSAHAPVFVFNTPARQLSLDNQAFRDEVEAALKEGGLGTIEWAHAIGEDVLFAADGAIYRVPKGAAIAPRDYLAAARKLIDLSDMKFELMRAPPEAMRWYGR